MVAKILCASLQEGNKETGAPQIKKGINRDYICCTEFLNSFSIPI